MAVSDWRGVQKTKIFLISSNFHYLKETPSYSVILKKCCNSFDFGLDLIYVQENSRIKLIYFTQQTIHTSGGLVLACLAMGGLVMGAAVPMAMGLGGLVGLAKSGAESVVPPQSSPMI